MSIKNMLLGIFPVSLCLAFSCTLLVFLPFTLLILNIGVGLKSYYLDYSATITPNSTAKKDFERLMMVISITLVVTITCYV